MEFLSQHGLRGMPLEAHLMVIDDILDPDVRSPQERAQLLLDHELLAATAELHLMSTFMELDDDGLECLRFKHGEWVWEIREAEEFLQFLRSEPEQLQTLVALVREALFKRFRDDAA